MSNRSKHRVVNSVCLVLLAALLLAGCWTRLDDPTSQSPDTSSVIPGSGGVVSGDRKTEYIFTPATTTLWTFDITEGGDGGVTLEVHDPDGNIVRRSESWIYMKAGITYKITMGVWTYTVGRKNSYTLTISPAGTIPGEGGEIQVDGYTKYAFTPDRSGSWTFSSNLNSGDSEPRFWVWDLVKDEEAGSNSEAGVFYDSMTLELMAETVYSVSVSFRLSGTGSYTLIVSPESP